MDLNEAFSEAFDDYFRKQIAIMQDLRVPDTDRKKAMIYILAILHDMADMLSMFDKKYGKE